MDELENKLWIAATGNLCDYISVTKIWLKNEKQIAKVSDSIFSITLNKRYSIRFQFCKFLLLLLTVIFLNKGHINVFKIVFFITYYIK